MVNKKAKLNSNKKAVKMKARLRFKLPNEIQDVYKDIPHVSLEGFRFTIPVNGENKSVVFTFDAAKIAYFPLSKNEFLIEYESEDSGPNFNGDISQGFFEYETIGLNEKDITASFLASATEIEEIAMMVTGETDDDCVFFLEHISFMNEKHRTFTVNQAVIDKYNT